MNLLAALQICEWAEGVVHTLLLLPANALTPDALPNEWTSENAPKDSLPCCC